ncbi:MAG: hypothetical protein PHH01_03780 [Patescibacteria group bacterium]|nr:hypothetical protein [Patescibacteria group bacterium]
MKWIGSNKVWHWLFQRICVITTPFWSGLAGFGIKLWLVDQKTKNYAGIYEWRDERSCRQYVEYLIPILSFFSRPETIWHSIYSQNDQEMFWEKAAIYETIE